MQPKAEADIFFGRRRVNPRLAWDPSFAEPTPDKTARGNINYDRSTNGGQPAIIFALDTWRGRYAVITANGWHLRSGGGEYRWKEIQLPLPDPLPTYDPASDLGWFRGLLRLDSPKHNASWQTLVSWMLRALQPDEKLGFQGYPILVLNGPPEAGKTITAKLLAQLLDPTKEPIHSLTGSMRNLQELITNHHILAFDHISKVSPKIAAELCATSCRSRHARPIILTTRRRDDTLALAERSVYVEMAPGENPIHPYDVWQKFEGLRPTILGAALTLLARTTDFSLAVS